MRFSFGLRSKSDGGMHLGTLPVFDLEGWERDASTGRAIVYRPTLHSFLWSLAALVLPTLSVAGLFWSVELPWNWGPSTPQARDVAQPKEHQELDRRTEELTAQLRERLSDAEWQEFTAKQQQQQAQRQAERQRFRTTGLWLGYAVWAILLPIVLIFVWIAWRFGLYDLLRFSFDRVEIDRDDAGSLVIRRPGLFNVQEVRQPVRELSHLALSFREEVTHRPYVHRGWVWFVHIFPHPASHAPQIAFSIERVHREPQDTADPPVRTKRFTKSLQKLTRLPLREPN